MLKIRNILLNSKAAIDLASIMVGIIVIGLIGGVIAATVFAVIPWAQDNAAKEQLESIHTAQNAGFGLSADPSRELATGQERNSFANSQGLESAGLLSLSTNGTYCTVNFSNTDGSSNYIGWVKSASGKVFYSTNNDKTAQEQTDGLFPCVVGSPVGSGSEQIPVGGYNPNPVDSSGNPIRDAQGNPVVIQPGATTPGQGNGSNPSNPGGNNGGGSGTPAPGPGYVQQTSWNFEDRTAQGWANGTTNTTAQSVNTRSHSGTHSLRVAGSSNISYISARTNYTQHEVGAQYRLTAWTYQENLGTGVTIAMSGNGVQGRSGPDGVAGQWVKHEVTYTATAANHSMIFYFNKSTNQASAQHVAYIDDVVLEKLA